MGFSTTQKKKKKHGPTDTWTKTHAHKPHAEIINHERLVALYKETVCKCNMGGSPKDKRMFIWVSCIEHHVRIRQKATDETIPTPFLCCH